MNKNFSVPDPCGENWEGMLPNANGRYCGSCQKTVVDFTNKSNQEILDYLKEQSGKRVCGTFKNSQLQSTSFQHNEHMIRFLAALLLVFGMSLFSCRSVTLGDREEQTAECQATTGIIITPPDSIVPFTDSIVLPEPGHAVEVQRTLGIVAPPVEPPEIITGDVVELPEEPGTIKVKKADSVEVVQFADVMPEFPGGASQLMSFISMNVNYPQRALETGTQGTVYVSFVVRTDGSINDVKLLRGIDPALDKEALRVVASLPSFVPGQNAGNAVNVRYTLPIKFQLK